MSITERLDPLGPSRCPRCGNHRSIYIRSGLHLVCLDCAEPTRKEDKFRPRRPSIRGVL